MESYYVGAYWGDRRESAVECARRLSDCLAALAKLDPLLSSWRHRGRSKAAAQAPVEMHIDALERLLLDGRNRRDTDRSVIEELGFRVGIWNGREPMIGLSASVGKDTGAPGLMNSFLLELPAPSGDAARLYDHPVALSIVEAIAASWEPDWATWASNSLRHAQDAPARTPVVGWMTFLSWGRLNSDFVTDVGAVSLLDGWLVPIGNDVSVVDVDAVLELRRVLHAAGALEPTP